MPENAAYVLYSNFRTGEAKQITPEEAARMAMEFQARCTIKGGVVYVDCEPPDDAR